jgi:Xaa-Pro aminopeptidase
MLLNKERAYKVMEKYGVEAIVASMPENVTYLTDFWSLSHWVLTGTPTYAVLPLEKKIEPFIVTPISELDLAAMEENCWVKDFHTFGTFYVESPQEAILSKTEQRMKGLLSSGKHKEDAVTALVDSLQERGLAKGRIALDEMNITPTLYRAIQRKLPGIDLVDGYPILREIRAVKTPQEVKRLERCAEITEKAFKKALEIIREGVRELEISRAFLNTLAEEGAVPSIVCIGVGSRSAFPNVIPTDHRVKKGDLIRFDIGSLYQYYYSDTARIAVLGKPSEKQRSYYQAIKEGEDRAFELIRPGARSPEIFDAAVQGVRKSGIPHYKRGHVGHGIGIECYDIPYLSPKSDHILEEGMVLNVETPYYELGFGGVQVEDTLVVTKDGYRFLTKADRNLFIL